MKSLQTWKIGSLNEHCMGMWSWMWRYSAAYLNISRTCVRQAIFSLSFNHYLCCLEMGVCINKTTQKWTANINVLVWLMVRVVFRMQVEVFYVPPTSEFNGSDSWQGIIMDMIFHWIGEGTLRSCHLRVVLLSILIMLLSIWLLATAFVFFCVNSRHPCAKAH